MEVDRAEAKLMEPAVVIAMINAAGMVRGEGR